MILTRINPVYSFYFKRSKRFNKRKEKKMVQNRSADTIGEVELAGPSVKSIKNLVDESPSVGAGAGDEITATFAQMFGEADNMDIAYMMIGSLGGIITGLSLPFFNVLFGEMLDNLNDDGSNFRDQINKVCVAFTGKKDILNSNYHITITIIAIY